LVHLVSRSSSFRSSLLLKSDPFLGLVCSWWFHTLLVGLVTFGLITSWSSL
jgi:hypothetical protein